MSDWLPTNRPDILVMAHKWIPALIQHEKIWEIPSTVEQELLILVETAEEALEQANSSQGNKHLNTKCREAFAALTKRMRLIKRKYFITPPLIESDYVLLGLPIPKINRTPHIEVNEMVEFLLRLRNIREIVIDFKVKGAANKAKPKYYHGAVIIWGVLDAPPKSTDELTRHTLVSRTPCALSFPESERGKTVYIAMSWENARSNIGQWSEILSAVIP